MSNFSHEIREKLKACGVDACGVTDASPPESYGVYCEAVRAGVPDGLGYLERSMALRADYEALLPGTRSIVCAAVRIGAFLKPSPWTWASFCALPDYHFVVRQVMERVLLVIRELTEVPNARICVDSAPILERDLAQRAGLGFIGHHRGLISPVLGSFILLGELLVDVDLSPWKSELSVNCSETRGACRCSSGMESCVRACPTGALSGDGYDMGRCIGYLTTQHKGDIPDELSAKIGGRIWGCDCCQRACPWNLSGIPVSDAENVLTSLSLEDILMLSVSQLRKRLKGSPLSGAHPGLLQRNACIVAGNLGLRSAVPLLEKVSREHSDAVVRRAAHWAVAAMSEL